MYISFKFLFAMLAIALLAACSKKEHEPVQGCIFAGKTSTRMSQTSKGEWGNELVLDDKKQLVTARRIDNLEAFNRWKQSTITDYVPQYDADGFLVRMVETRVFLYEGTTGFSYRYYSKNYLKFRLETIVASDYQYESGRATAITTKTTVRSQGDSDAPVVVESELTKKYTYNSQNVALSALTTSASGSDISTFKNGVIASEIRKDASGVVTLETLYDEKGNRKTTKSGNYLYEFDFDAKGNIKSVKFSDKGQPNYLQEYSYDDHVNPETHIPVKFKGIPENVTTVVGTESVNNLVREKFTSYIGAPSYDTETVYQYNADGLPASSAPKIIPNGKACPPHSATNAPKKQTRPATAGLVCSSW